MDSLLEAMLDWDDRGEATAVRVKSYFAGLGLAPSEINSDRLQEIYAVLDRARNPPATDSTVASNLTPFCTPFCHEVCGVIIETRKNPALLSALNQFAQRLNFPIQLFHGSTNEEFILHSPLRDLICQGQIILTKLSTRELSGSEFNALLLTTRFWEAMAGRRKILVFQPDSILCNESDYGLADFLGFDYIGSTWQRKRPTGIVADGGSGGLSLRDWGRSIECLERFPADRWTGGEDGYFSFHLDVMDARVGRMEDCGKFSTQSQFLSRSFGAHQISLLSPQDQKRFFDYCPEARMLVP